MLRHTLNNKTYKMKKILKSGISLMLLTSLLVSCETTEEVVQDRSTKPVGELVSTATVTVVEGASTTITVTTPTPSNKAISYKIYQVGGNAVMGEDYTFATNSAADFGPIGGKVVIPAYSSTGSVELMALTDYKVDSNNATFELREMEAMNGTVGTASKFTANFTSFVSDDLELIMSWKTTDEENYHGDSQDLDFAIEDAAGNEVLSAYTGDFPENIVMPGTMADGDYYINVDFWAPEDFSFPGDPSLFDTAYYFQIGKVGAFQITTADSDWVTSEYLQWSTYWRFGGDGWKARVAQITKAGTTYTIKDMSGATLVSGKFSNKKSPRTKTEGVISL